MSTELKSRSKAYNLTRVAIGAPDVGLVVGQGWNRPSVTLSIGEIEEMFASGDFTRATSMLDLLDESIERLKIDLAQFVMSKGNGMERDYYEYTAETYAVINTGETGWCVKRGPDTVCDVYAGEQIARRIAEALNQTA